MPKGNKSFYEYLNNGGFPEFLEFKNRRILQELFNDVINRDIIVRYGIRNPMTIKKLALFLLSNAAKEISYHNLTDSFNLGSVNTVISYINYMEDCYLIFQVPKFDYSTKKQLVNPRKVYIIDTGLIKANTLSFSDDLGRMLENLVFIKLKDEAKEIYYYKNRHECDFVIRNGNHISELYQVCYQLNNDNKDREIKGLLTAMEEFRIHTGLILTFEQDDKFMIDNKTIMVQPVWKWMLTL